MVKINPPRQLEISYRSNNDINFGNPAQPFLKWAGGKTQLLPMLSHYIPPTYNHYIEPMLGGGALFFYLKPTKAILADLNKELIDCYIVVRDKVIELISELQNYYNDEKFYYEIRAQDPYKLNIVQRAARMIFLNKTCYNGLYRVNKKGEFNVPFGRRKKPNIYNKKKLLSANKVLQGVKLIAGDYNRILVDHAQKGDFVYIDPPYYPAGGFADFRRYNMRPFYEEDHINLRDIVIRLVDSGVFVLLTNSNTDFVRKLYAGFEYEAVDARRNISSRSSTRFGQDLLVIGTKQLRKTRRGITGGEIPILHNFPGTRYMGSKYKLIPFLNDFLSPIDYSSVLDAFSGSACVSYFFKQQGKQVFANDFMQFTFHFAKAIIENCKIRLNKVDTEFLVQKNQKAGSFIAETYRGLYFSDKENQFLDNVRANIDRLSNAYKQSIALAALARACIKRRPRGVFTFTGDRYNDGRRDLQLSLSEHFYENIDAFNRAVFDNGKANIAYGKDIFEIDIEVDLVYIDPPYLTEKSDNDYSRRYHFVEGLVRNWKGVEIQHNTKTKKFKRYETPFSSKTTIYDAFDSLFKKFRDQILVVSYSSNSIPDKSTLVSMLKKYKKRVRVHQISHTYSFGTHAHKTNSKANRAIEYMFLAF